MRVYFSDTNFDFPKRINDLRLAWFNEGKICIARNLKPRKMQKQNFNLLRVNSVVKEIYQELTPQFKKELAIYCKQYKQAYPHLRKRGMSSYAVLLMITHSLIKRFSIPTVSKEEMSAILKTLIYPLSIIDAVQLRILKRIKNVHQLNHKAKTYSNTKISPFYPENLLINPKDHLPYQYSQMRYESDIGG